MICTTDGKLNIDNNPVENSIRPVALGRKNYLFAGSHEAAQRSARYLQTEWYQSICLALGGAETHRQTSHQQNRRTTTT
jgi:hypothetical protein